MNSEWIVIIVGVLVAMSCSLVGTFLVLRKMGMIGDAISHAVLPGIVIAFLITGSRDSVFMLVGAAIFGLLTVYLVTAFIKSGVQSDAAIGVVFTALFAFGVLLITLYADHIDLDLDCVLYGEIAYTPWVTIEWFGQDVGPKALWLLGGSLFINALVIGLFYKQFKIISFDPAMAAAIGIPVIVFHYVLMGLVSLTTVASFESVGAILVVGMLIIPPATAYLLTDRLFVMIGLGMGIGATSAVVGYVVSAWTNTSISGSMIMVAGVFFLLALLFSPKHGVIAKKWAQRKWRAV